jgi:hypothetical protein
MLVQRVLTLTPDLSLDSWTVLGDGGPVEPIERYLAYLSPDAGCVDGVVDRSHTPSVGPLLLLRAVPGDFRTRGTQSHTWTMSPASRSSTYSASSDRSSAGAVVREVVAAPARDPCWLIVRPSSAATEPDRPSVPPAASPTSALRSQTFAGRHVPHGDRPATRIVCRHAPACGDTAGTA